MVIRVVWKAVGAGCNRKRCFVGRVEGSCAAFAWSTDARTRSTTGVELAQTHSRVDAAKLTNVYSGRFAVPDDRAEEFPERVVASAVHRRPLGFPMYWLAKGTQRCLDKKQLEGRPR